MNLSILHSSVNSFTSLFFSIGCLLSHFSHVRVYMTTRTIPTRILCPWYSPGKNTGVFCHVLLQGILPTQGSNLHLLHCRQILYQESPSIFLLLLKLEMLTVLTYFKLPRQENFNSSLSPSSFTLSIQLAHFILLIC